MQPCPVGRLLSAALSSTARTLAVAASARGRRWEFGAPPQPCRRHTTGPPTVPAAYTPRTFATGPSQGACSTQLCPAREPLVTSPCEASGVLRACDAISVPPRYRLPPSRRCCTSAFHPSSMRMRSARSLVACVVNRSISHGAKSTLGSHPSAAGRDCGESPVVCCPIRGAPCRSTYTPRGSSSEGTRP